MYSLIAPIKTLHQTAKKLLKSVSKSAKTAELFGIDPRVAMLSSLQKVLRNLQTETESCRKQLAFAKKWLLS